MTMLLSSPEPVDNRTIVDECLTFLFAGYDTTSVLLVTLPIINNTEQPALVTLLPLQTPRHPK
jgi:hypothetical protein